jgi:preprotein translocase subunit SecG
MENVLLVIHLLVALALVVVILLQRSEGGALGGLGGGGGAAGFVTARGAGNILTRATSILATIFILTSLSLSIIAQPRATAQKKSILDAAPKAEQSVPAPDAAPMAPISAE